MCCQQVCSQHSCLSSMINIRTSHGHECSCSPCCLIAGYSPSPNSPESPGPASPAPKSPTPSPGGLLCTLAACMIMPADVLPASVQPAQLLEQHDKHTHITWTRVQLLTLLSDCRILSFPQQPRKPWSSLTCTQVTHTEPRWVALHLGSMHEHASKCAASQCAASTAS